MPIYEYKCDSCNEIWEEIQKFSDDPLTICKSCKKEGEVHKLFTTSRNNFILYGDGDTYRDNRHHKPGVMYKNSRGHNVVHDRDYKG